MPIHLHLFQSSGLKWNGKICLSARYVYFFNPYFSIHVCYLSNHFEPLIYLLQSATAPTFSNPKIIYTQDHPSSNHSNNYPSFEIYHRTHSFPILIFLSNSIPRFITSQSALFCLRKNGKYKSNRRY